MSLLFTKVVAVFEEGDDVRYCNSCEKIFKIGETYIDFSGIPSWTEGSYILTLCQKCFDKIIKDLAKEPLLLLKFPKDGFGDA